VRPVGVLRMVDEAGADEKILAVPINKVYPGYAHIEHVDDVPKHWLDRIGYSSSTTRTSKPASGSSSMAGAVATKPGRCWSIRSRATTTRRTSRTSEPAGSP
jgi:inorganic pyrophosphatase